MPLNIQQKLKVLKQNSLVLYYACTSPNLSLWKKLFISIVVGYLFSPIDLIPDFIPIIGYIDDLIIVPIGIYIAMRIIPKEILEESKTKINEMKNEELPIGKKTAIGIIILWIIGLLLFFQILFDLFSKRF